MRISEAGHVVNGDESTTNPFKSPFFVGDENQRIYFDFLLMDDGDIALHSQYGCVEDRYSEVFLYEVMTPNEAEASAVSMVNDAIEYLHFKGVVDLESNAAEFVSKLHLTTA